MTISANIQRMHMYMPPQFKAKDAEHAAALIRAYPFASLISTDDDGFPFITHLPAHLIAEPGQPEAQWLLLAHVAKPNPHWRYLQARPKALLSFMGPQAYMSPSVYPDLVRVPTWTYLAVHCTVTATLVDDPLAKDQLLKKLIGDHEPPYAQQWRGLGEEFAQKMLAGIVGMELRVTDVQCKLKLNQHRPEAHERMHAQYASGNEQERALAHWMERLGLYPKPATGVA